MNPFLNYSPLKSHECEICFDWFEIDYSKITYDHETVECPHCNALYRVDHDAEFIGGVWTDKTKIKRL